jgi:hypothetical protein
MFAWTPRATGHVAPGDPSPLLTHLAGEFAPRIAGLWPAPHAVFLTADSARRHLLCLRLAQGEPRHLARIAETALHAPLKRAIAEVLLAPPPGLRRALEHMGVIAWPRSAYLALLDLLAHPEAAKVLRHAANVTVQRTEALTALPRPMLDAGGGRLGLDLERAQLAREIYDGLVLRDGHETAAMAARRWARAPSMKDALGLMQQDMVPTLPPAPFVGTSRLRPLKSEAEMREAALRYRNCLRDCIASAATGESAYYEWMGEPKAVVEITRDGLFGWRLCQVRLADNAAVPEPARQSISAELRAIGVHVGRSDWELRNALARAARPGFRFEPAHEALDYVFADD